MRRSALLALLLAGAVAAGQDLTFPKSRTKVRALAFEVSVPEGWTVEQDHTGLVAHDGKRNGFQVSREPMLFDEDEFGERWQADLAKAGKDVEVGKERVRREKAWRARWKAGDRTIDVWRLYRPSIEMLYNVSFSVGKGVELEPIVEGVLDSFRCTAEEPELKFQRTAVTITNRITLRLPEGYVKAGGRRGGLGGGLSGGFVKVLPGYDPPHVAGQIRFRQFNPRVTYGRVPGTDTDGLVEAYWEEVVKGDLGEVTKRPRRRSARFRGLKGDSLEVHVRTKEGLPKIWFGFCGKHSQEVALIAILVDAREERLHKDLFRDILNELEVRD